MFLRRRVLQWVGQLALWALVGLTLGWLPALIVCGAYCGFVVGQGLGHSEGLRHGLAIHRFSFLAAAEDAAAEQLAPDHPVREAIAADKAEVVRQLPSRRTARKLIEMQKAARKEAAGGESNGRASG